MGFHKWYLIDPLNDHILIRCYPASDPCKKVKHSACALYGHFNLLFDKSIIFITY